MMFLGVSDPSVYAAHRNVRRIKQLYTIALIRQHARAPKRFCTTFAEAEEMTERGLRHLG